VRFDARFAGGEMQCGLRLRWTKALHRPFFAAAEGRVTGSADAVTGSEAAIS